MERIGYAATAIMCSLVACGSPGEQGVQEGEAGEEELVAQTREALSSAFDRPPAAAAEVQTGSTRALWVFACDTQGRLRLNIRSAGASWVGWVTLASDCADVPTAGRWGDEDPSTPDHVVAYYRNTSNRLVEVWFPTATDSSNRILTDISSASGIDDIAGAPQIAESDLTSDFISVVVRSDQNNVHTVDWFDGAWHFNKVLVQSGSSTAIKSTRPFRVLMGWWGCDLGCERPPTYISGRGLTSTDTSTGWLAGRPFASPTEGGSLNFVRFPASDVIASGTAVVYNPPSYTSAVTFSDDLLGIRAGTTGSWSLQPGCDVGGSPMVNEGGFGFIRGGSDNLFRWLNNNVLECADLGGGLSSAPVAIRSIAATAATFGIGTIRPTPT